MGYARHEGMCHHYLPELNDGCPRSMANAEKLLHEAQYAFQSISYGESRDNKRNASRAKSLCEKIIRKFPTSMEAGEAHAVLRRLGEEAYSSKMKSRHRHITQATHHRTPTRTPTPKEEAKATRASQRTFVTDDGVETLDWGALIKWAFTVPKYVLGLVAFAGIFLFGLLGPFLFLPLIAFVFLTGPFRKTMKREQREQLNIFVKRVNAHVAEQLNLS